jgi:hypothetical protein
MSATPVNHMAAAFGLNTGAVGMAAASAVAAVFGSSGSNSNSILSGNNNLLVNLNNSSYPYMSQSNATNSWPSSQASSDYHNDRIEW